MNTGLAVKNKVMFFLLWIGVSMLGWLLAPIDALTPNLRTYLEVANHALIYAGFGLLLGLVIGLGEFLLLKQNWHATKRWFWMTLAGYTLALPLGLALSTLIPAISFSLQGSSFLPLSQPGSLYFFPFPTDLVMGAWIVGIAQWWVLRDLLPYRNSRMALLWILGVWVSLAFGMYALIIARGGLVNVNSGSWFDGKLAIERLWAGGVSGLGTGLLLLFVIDQAGKRVLRRTPLADSM